MRDILRKNVPSWEKGEVKISELAVEYPYLLTALARNLKANIQDQEMLDRLAQITQQTQFDEKALLQVVGAMFDMEIVIANPPGESWDGTQAIPVFYIPVIDDDVTEITGIDSDFNLVTLPAEIKEYPYSLLAVNFDEDPEPTGTSNSLYRPKNERPFNIWEFFVSPAWAHKPNGHKDCHQYRLIQQAREIVIYKDHEPGPNKPEIQIEVYYKKNTVSSLPRHNLPNVDVEDSVYTEYEDLRTRHGTCWEAIEKIQVWEDDASSDDNVAYWTDVAVGHGGIVVLTPDNADDKDRDAKLKIQQQRDNNPH